MSKKRTTGRRKTPSPKKDGALTPPIDPRALEKGISDIGRVLAGQEFESMEAVQAFMNNLMANGGAENLTSFAPAADTPLDQAQDLMYEAWGRHWQKQGDLGAQGLGDIPRLRRCLCAAG